MAMSGAGPVDLSDDPGWWPAVPLLPRAVIFSIRPGFPIRTAKDPLLAMRAALVVWVLVLLVIGGVSLWLPTAIRAPRQGPALGVGVALIGAAGSAIALIEIKRKSRRALASADVESMPQRVVASMYLQSFFLRGAFSNSAGVAGFVGVILAGITAPFVIGLVVAGVGLAYTAPTAGNLRRFEQTLGLSGSRLDLVSVLRTPLADPLQPGAGT